MVLHAGHLDPRQFHDLLGSGLLSGAGGHGLLSPAVCRASLEAGAMLVLLGDDPAVCVVCRGRLYCAGCADWEEI